MGAALMPPTVDESIAARVSALSNDGLIIELLQTLNHLSRWLTPVHDMTRLNTSLYRSEPSVKDVLFGLRDTEGRVYSLMNAIATQTNPDLDRVPAISRTVQQEMADHRSNALVAMSEFRRVRESTTALLRALPDSAWKRGGYSRQERDWTIRDLAEFLAVNDWARLGEIDQMLTRLGVRSSIAEVSRVSLTEIKQPFSAAIGRE